MSMHHGKGGSSCSTMGGTFNRSYSGCWVLGFWVGHPESGLKLLTSAVRMEHHATQTMGYLSLSTIDPCSMYLRPNEITKHSLDPFQNGHRKYSVHTT